MSVTVGMLVEAAYVKITCQYGTRVCQYVRLDIVEATCVYPTCQ
jgi:hypothetical protein